MKRDAYKFLAGTTAGLAYTHAAFALAAAKGIMNEPVFMGRKWKVGFMWTEAAIYSALSLWLAFRGWSQSDSQAQLR